MRPFAAYAIAPLCYLVLNLSPYLLRVWHPALWVGAVSFPLACYLEWRWRSQRDLLYPARFLLHVISFSAWMPIVTLAVLVLVSVGR
jgi:hypothetical protein